METLKRIVTSFRHGPTGDMFEQVETMLKTLDWTQLGKDVQAEYTKARQKAYIHEVVVTFDPPLRAETKEMKFVTSYLMTMKELVDDIQDQANLCGDFAVKCTLPPIDASGPWIEYTLLPTDTVVPLIEKKVVMKIAPTQTSLWHLPEFEVKLVRAGDDAKRAPMRTIAPKTTVDDLLSYENLSWKRWELYDGDDHLSNEVNFYDYLKTHEVRIFTLKRKIIKEGE